jgi:hypothetical protein
MPLKLRLVTLAGASLAVLALSGCASDESASSTTSEPTVQETTTTAPAPSSTAVTSSTRPPSIFAPGEAEALDNLYLKTVRGNLSPALSDLLPDSDLLTFAGNICNEIRTDGVDAFVARLSELLRDVEAGTAPEGSYRPALAVATVGTAVYCTEYHDEWMAKGAAAGL